MLGHGKDSKRIGLPISRKTEVDKELLEKTYLEKVTKEVKKILPAWVSCKLSASVSAVPEGTKLPEYFKVNETKTCSFTKPRASKKSKSEEDK